MSNKQVLFIAEFACIHEGDKEYLLELAQAVRHARLRAAIEYTWLEVAQRAGDPGPENLDHDRAGDDEDRE